MTRRLVLALAAAVALLSVTSCTSGAGVAETTGPTASSLPPGDRGTVDRVVDGDTVIVDGTRVRLIGIDAPESVKPGAPVGCFGPEASLELSQLLPRRTAVLLEYDVERLDQYGRTLAYVWTTKPAELVNLDLVRGGFATVYTFPPNVKHEPELEAAQSRARRDHVGLWGACS